MECHRLNENVVVHSEGWTDEEEFVTESQGKGGCPSQRRNCTSGWSSPNKTRREDERLRARQTACALVRSRSEQRLNNTSHSPGKSSPSKKSRRKERECRSLRNSPMKARRTRTTKSNESMEEEEVEEENDDVPSLLRKASDELLKYFEEEEGKEKVKERPDRSGSSSSFLGEEDETTQSEKCDQVKCLRRKNSVYCRTFANSQCPSKANANRGLGTRSEHGYTSPEKSKIGGDVSVRLSTSSHSPRRQLSQIESPSRAAQSVLRRHKTQLSSKYNNMIEHTRHGGATKPSLVRQISSVDSEVIPLSTEKSSMATCLQFIPNRSLPGVKNVDGEIVDQTSKTPPITNKKGIQFHCSALVQNKIQLDRRPLSPKKPSSRPRELKRDISVHALKAAFCEDKKEAKESPVLVKRNLGAKTIFGNMMGAFQIRSD